MAEICGRKEASGPGWCEHFVDAKRASNASSVGSAVSQSLSYVTISHFASIEERRALVESAADMKTDEALVDGDSSSHILFASSANTNCDRYSVRTLLNEGAKTASSALLDRLLGFLDGSGGDSMSNDPHFISLGGGEKMSLLANEVFGSSSDLRSMEAVWYDEPDEAGKLHPEPKVNLYTEGGFFSQHNDGMDLTILVVLTDEFEGVGQPFTEIWIYHTMTWTLPI